MNTRPFQEEGIDNESVGDIGKEEGGDRYGSVLVISAGELIQRWTNSYWQTAKHRIRASQKIYTVG